MKEVLIIGAGGIGKRHIRGFLRTGRVRLSVVEPMADRRKEVLAAYAIERGFADLAEVDLAAVDLAVICTPANTHIPLGQCCAESGASILPEKPLSTSLEGVDRLIRTVSAKRRTARVAYVRRSSPELITMHEQVRSGQIGELRMSYMNVSQDFPKYRPDYRETYYAKEASGGGAILDSASHLIDVLIWFFGEPSEVAAMYDRLELRGVECEDACLIAMRFRNGGLAQININQFQKPNTCTIEMIGAKGNLLLEHSVLKSAMDDSGQCASRDFMQGLQPIEVHENWFRFQADRMLDAIDGQPDHLTTLEEAVTNLRVVLGAKESYRTKQIVQIG